MKITLFMILCIGLFSCQEANTKNEGNKIIYEIKQPIQDTIRKVLNKKSEIFGDETELKYFITYRESKEGDEQVFTLDYCYSNKDEKDQGRDGCAQYNDILKNTNRFLKLQDKFIPMVFSPDLEFTDSKKYLSAKVGGTTIFILDRDGNLKKTMITM